MKLPIAILFVVLLLAPACGLFAENWTTTDGKTYQKVKVLKVGADTVTILHHDGGGQIALAKLSPELQQRFKFDPAAAQVAADKKAKEAAANRLAMRAREAAAEAQQKQAAQAPPTTTTGSATSVSSAPNPTLNSTGLQDPGGLGPNDAGTAHYSINALSSSMHGLRPDLTDPDYHTMAHMVYVIRQEGLGPDTSDGSHHTIGEIAGH